MGFLLGLVFFGLLAAALVLTALYVRDKLLNKYGKSREDRPHRSVLSFVLWYALAFIALTVWTSYTQVDSGSVGVVYRQGKAVRTIQPGPHILTPFLENASPVSVKTLVVKPNEGGSSNDLQLVTTQVTLAYHFDPNYAMYFATQLIDSSENAVENKVVNPAIIEAVKATTAQFSATDLIQKRATVRDAIDQFVQARLNQYHIITETVSITDFAFSKEYNDSIEQKVTAQQDAEKAQNVLQKVKIEAEQKIAAAQGEAAALKAQKEQITPELLQLRMIEMLKEKWDGHLPESYFGGSAPLPIVDAFKNSHIEKK